MHNVNYVYNIYINVKRPLSCLILNVTTIIGQLPLQTPERKKNNLSSVEQACNSYLPNCLHEYDGSLMSFHFAGNIKFKELHHSVAFQMCQLYLHLTGCVKKKKREGKN